MRRAVLLSLVLHALVAALLLLSFFRAPEFRVQVGAGGPALTLEREAAPATHPITIRKAETVAHAPVIPRPTVAATEPKAVPVLAAKFKPHPLSAAAPPPAVASMAAFSAHPPSVRHAATANREAGAEISAQPEYLDNPAPEYPPEAQEAREQGTVLLLVEVEIDGRAGRLSIARSSGYPDLDAEAVRTVKRWRFRPATLGGLALVSQVEVPIQFHLTAAGPA
jgi:protein TonB